MVLHVFYQVMKVILKFGENFIKKIFAHIIPSILLHLNNGYRTILVLMVLTGLFILLAKEVERRISLAYD